MQKVYKYGLYAGAGVIGFILLRKGIKSYREAQTRKRIQNAIPPGGSKTSLVLSKKTGESVLPAVNTTVYAQQIAEALGTNSSWFNPSSWTEDEDKVTELILKVPQAQMRALAGEYDKLYKRSLPDDLLKYLDSDNYKKISSKIGG
jgi:hypothetical protein